VYLELVDRGELDPGQDSLVPTAELAYPAGAGE
jgi:hypothetical protein